jgi:hypothetical protein
VTYSVGIEFTQSAVEAKGLKQNLYIPFCNESISDAIKVLLAQVNAGASFPRMRESRVCENTQKYFPRLTLSGFPHSRE